MGAANAVAPQIGARNSTAIARSQGASPVRPSSGLGINVDLAPVADVPSSTSSIMYRQGRTYSFSASRTAALADAFATAWSRGCRAEHEALPGARDHAATTPTRRVVTIARHANAASTDLRPIERRSPPTSRSSCCRTRRTPRTTRQRGGLVAGDRRHAPPPGPRLHRRDDHRFADGHGGVTWRRRVPPGARRCAGGDGLHPPHGFGGFVAGRSSPAARLRKGGIDLEARPCGRHTSGSSR